MRAFLAIPLRGSALAQAQEVLTRLRDHVPAVRWARPETLHVTLHFFGQLSDKLGRKNLFLVTLGYTWSGPA